MGVDHGQHVTKVLNATTIKWLCEDVSSHIVSNYNMSNIYNFLLSLFPKKVAIVFDMFCSFMEAI